MTTTAWKDFARPYYHQILRVRRFVARQLLARIDRSGGRPSMDWLVRVARRAYQGKRWVQEFVRCRFPFSDVERRVIGRRFDGDFLASLLQWSDWSLPVLDDNYTRSAANNRLTANDRLRMSQTSFESTPLLSVVVPIHNTPTPWLNRLIASVQNQVYDRWELVLVDDASTDSRTVRRLEELAETDDRIVLDRLPTNGGVSRASNRGIELSSGEWIALVDHDDELLPDALWHVVEFLQRQSECDIVYSDEELVPAEGTPYPYFKPDFAPEQLTAFNYLCHLLVFRRSLFDRLGGFRPETDGAQDFDWILRAVESGARIGHIPRILYRWRLAPNSLSRVGSKNSAPVQRDSIQTITQKVVQDHFDRTATPARAIVENGWSLPRFDAVDRGKVSIIICTKDNPGLLRRAIRSIVRRTDYPNYEIVIVDNGNKTWPARTTIAWLGLKHRVIRIASDERGFNYSRLNNEAARKVDGEFLLFLNDDVEVRTDNWLSALVGNASILGVGVAGARLLYPDGTVQHAGVVAGTMGWGPWHAFLGSDASRRDLYCGYVTHPHNAVAVTGACLLTRRDLFLELGGFDEVNFAVSYNDVDYCLRVRENGRRIAYVPQAELIHHEGSSRGSLVRADEMAALHTKYRGIVDPYWNPNFSRNSHEFRVSGRRLARRLHSSPPRTLVVGPPSHAPGMRAYWEALDTQLVRQLHCESTAMTLGEDIESTKEQVRRRIEEGMVDVIFAHGVEAAPIIELAHAEKIPSVWHLPEGIETVNPSVDDLASAKQYLKMRRLLELPYRVVYNNPATLSAIVSRQCRGGNADWIESMIFDAAIDVDRREAVREDWGVSDRQVAFLAVTPPVESEWETILAAFHRVADEDGFLFLVLHGETTDEIDRAIFGLLRQLRDNVAVLINPTRLHYLYQAADVFVAHPSADLRSIDMLRALEHRLPLLGTEAMVQAQILVPGLNGEAVTAHRPGELARAMYRLIRDPERRTRYSQAAGDYLKSRSHGETVLAEWRDLLGEAAELNERTPRPAPVEPSSLTQSTEAGTLAEISSIDRSEKTG